MDNDCAELDAEVRNAVIGCGVPRTLCMVNDHAAKFHGNPQSICRSDGLDQAEGFLSWFGDRISPVPACKRCITVYRGSFHLSERIQSQLEDFYWKNQNELDKMFSKKVGSAFPLFT